jgi:nucleotide-binding universal stress UspA family protein
MKNIIVPFDFSVCAYSALHYAAEMATVGKVQLIILNSFNSFLPEEDSRISDSSYEELKSMNKHALEKVVLDIKNMYPIDALYYSSDHSLSAALKKAIPLHNAGLLIMGMRGYSSAKRQLLGSNTIQLIEERTIPVIAIPEHYKYTPLKSIVFATDYKDIQEKKLDILYDIMNLYCPQLTLLKVYEEEENEDSTLTEAKTGLLLHHKFEKFKHEFKWIKADEVVLGIEEFVKLENPDLICIIPEEHTFFENLFKTTTTEILTVDAIKPLLALV